MKSFFLCSLFLSFLLSSCNRGIFVTIDNKKYNYGKNTEVRFFPPQGTPLIRYGIEIKTLKKSDTDSSFFVLAVGRANVSITAGDYSFPNTDRTNFTVSDIAFYDSKGNRYGGSGGDEDGTTFIITSINKRRAKGWFKGKLVDSKADTAKPSNTKIIEGRFNVSLKHVQYF